KLSCFQINCFNVFLYSIHIAFYGITSLTLESLELLIQHLKPTLPALILRLQVSLFTSESPKPSISV
ncbi:MAG: hypothetical protein MJZ34_16230, partial [Paludibacteraceae bacterium]|nr:hypothetical protein [Paludibacteraceae bacterium]